MDEHVGLLVVHGIGEQKRFETSRQLAQSILAALGTRSDGSRYNLIDRATQPEEFALGCPAVGRFDSPFSIACRAKDGISTRYLHIHEVWWADLGAPASLSEQIRFWLWGLGQWNAEVVWATHLGRPSNTDKFMDPPTKFRDVRNPNSKTRARPLTRTLLFFTGLYALLTLVSWEAVKRLFSWASKAAGSPAILTSYVGDVRIYTQAPGKGGGNLTDLGQPWRATIRRRMVGEMVAMAERRFNRWYVMAHSLGSVLAFNGLQETEWNLPNYLDAAQAARLRGSGAPDGLIVTDAPPAGSLVPDFDVMMPRRPVWLGNADRISRRVLFAEFAGLITYGSPLDKFAALWPRIVPVNKERDVFGPEVDWVNLSDVTDPVGSTVDAFSQGWGEATPPMESPINIRVRASLLYLLAHIRYFGAPRGRTGDKPETRALVEVLFPAGPAARLRDAFANVSADYGNGRVRAAFAALSVLGLGLALVAATSWLALMLQDLIGVSVGGLTTWLSNRWPDNLGRMGITPDILENGWKGLVGLLSRLPGEGFPATMLYTLLFGCAVVLAAGLWRRASEE